MHSPLSAYTRPGAVPLGTSLADDPRPNDLWTCITKEHNKQVFRVSRVTPLNVQCMGVSKSVRGQTHSFKLEIFRRDFRIERRAAWAGGRPETDEPPPPEAEPSASEAPPNGRLLDALPPDEVVYVAPPTPARPARHAGGRPGLLSPAQTREVYRLAWEGDPYPEIAKAYGISASYVGRIRHGHEKSHITGHRPGQPPVLPPPPPVSEEAPMESVSSDPRQELAARIVVRGGSVQTPSARLAAGRQISPERAAALARDLDAVLAPEPDPQPLVPSDAQATDQRALLLEMAEAIVFLLGHAGVPLPRFLKIDEAGLLALVEEARDLAHA